MTVGAIVIPLAALALCAVGLALAWRLVRRAEASADGADAAPVQSDQAAGGDSEPSAGKREGVPGGAVRVVGQLMALAGIGLGALAVAFALWRAFALHPLWLAATAIAICGSMAAWGWRILRRRPRP